MITGGDHMWYACGFISNSPRSPHAPLTARLPFLHRHVALVTLTRCHSLCLAKHTHMCMHNTSRNVSHWLDAAVQWGYLIEPFAVFRLRLRMKMIKCGTLCIGS